MIRRLVLLLAATSLTACVSVLPEQKAPEGLYRFGPMDALHMIDASVVVREPEASRLFGGRAIAAEDSSGALRLIKGVEWSDSATRLMQVALLDTLGGDNAHQRIMSWHGAFRTSPSRAPRRGAALRRPCLKGVPEKSWPRQTSRHRQLRSRVTTPHVQRP